VEVQLHFYSSTSALDGGEWSASRPGRLTPKERAQGTHWTGSWMGRRAVLDAVVKRKIPSPRRESKPRTPTVQPVTHCYIDWAITALPARSIRSQKALLWLKFFVRMPYDVFHQYHISECVVNTCTSCVQTHKPDNPTVASHFTIKLTQTQTPYTGIVNIVTCCAGTCTDYLYREHHHSAHISCSRNYLLLRNPHVFHRHSTGPLLDPIPSSSRHILPYHPL
jgi:hypothetical protein